MYVCMYDCLQNEVGSSLGQAVMRCQRFELIIHNVLVIGFAGLHEASIPVQSWAIVGFCRDHLVA